MRKPQNFVMMKKELKENKIAERGRYGKNKITGRGRKSKRIKFSGKKIKSPGRGFFQF